jgi:hypothetical protein
VTFGRYVLTAQVTMPWPAVWSEIIGGSPNTPVTTPAVPATTITATNSTGFPVVVTVVGATVTAVTVSSVQVGSAAGSYLVPYLDTISLTYATGSPTWTWAVADMPSSGTSSFTGPVSATAPITGQAGTIPQFTWFAGQPLWLDTNGPLYAALNTAGAALRAWIDGTDNVSHFGLSN